MKIPLIKGDTVDNNVDYRDALPVNMYAINRKIFESSGYMINFFGLSYYADGFNVDRGGIWVSRATLEGHYRVSGTRLLSIDQYGSTTDLGEIPGSGQVSMDYSFNNLAIVANGCLYYYNQGSGLRQITDIDVGNPIDIVWVDGLFFLTDGESIYTSNVANEEEYEPLDFGNAEFVPDPSRGLSKNEDNEILVFGEFSTEYFINTGASNFPFQRIQAKAQKIGIIGTHTKAEMNAKFYTLSRRKETSPSFHIISLGNEKSISTRETDKILAKYGELDLSQVTIDAVVIDNVKMVMYHLPNDTLLYNESIADTMGVDSAWSILKTDVKGDNTFRAKNFVRDPRSSKWTTGDKLDGRIGFLDESLSTHYDEIAEWILFTPFLKLESASVDKLEVETIPGITADNTPSTAIEFATANGILEVQSFGPSANLEVVSGNSYTFSVFVKDNGAQYVALSFDIARFGANPEVSFDMVNCVVDSNVGGNQYYIQKFDNGWIRVSLTMTCISSGTERPILVAMIGGGPGLSSVGDGTGLFATGAQLEINTIPTKYTKTEGVPRGGNLELYSENIGFWSNKLLTTMVLGGIGPMLLTDDTTVAISFTTDGRTYSNEFFRDYGNKNDYRTRLYVRRLGYVRDYIGVKLRGASRSRMAFSGLDLEVS